MTPPKPFEEPRALDLLADFRKRYGTLIDRRRSDLETEIEKHRDEGPSFAMRAVLDELESLRFFEPDLHYLIRAFAEEAIRPLHQILTDAAAFNLPRGMVLVDKATLEELPPIADREMWRGQARGVWYRVVLRHGYRPELQVSFNATLGEEHETWQSGGA